MKIARIVREDVSCLAWRDAGGWHDLTYGEELRQARTHGPYASPPLRLEPLLAAGVDLAAWVAEVRAAAREAGQLDALRLSDPPGRFLAPLAPGKLLCLGRNYAAHAAETGHDAPAEPIVFAKAPSSVIGPGDPIVLHDVGRVDHEAELAVVIGKRLNRAEPSQCSAAIAGYTLLNDVTARDWQKKDIGAGHPWFMSKSLDTFGPLGPVVALPDELDPTAQVAVICRVNGEERQRSHTGNFLFSIPEVLAYITRFITLEPGDVVSTGTPEGIAPLAAGDLVEVEVPEIGILANPVVAPKEA